MTALNHRQIAIFLISGVLLLVPLIAMQLTNEVNWTLMDFVVAACLLLTAGLTCEWIMRIAKRKIVRVALVTLGIVLFLLIWAELAVGIFGTPFAGS